MIKHTTDQLCQSARKYKTRTEWARGGYNSYMAARRRPELFRTITANMQIKKSGPLPKYTCGDLCAAALQFTCKKDWERGDYATYKAATRQPCIFEQVTRHMRFPGSRNRRHTDDDIARSALRFKHKVDWLRNDSSAYQAASNQPELFAKVTCHMKPKVSPYSGDYQVYVYEFLDRSAYVGLTFKPERRHQAHLDNGPVCRHITKCKQYVTKVIAAYIKSPCEAIKVEADTIKTYTSTGWTMLNKAKAGSLGCVKKPSSMYS